MIERARGRGELRISTASVFELAGLYVAGRLAFSRSPESWVRQSIESGGLRVSEVTLSVAIDAGLIPSTALADPFDRLVVASARQLDVPLVTRDQRILGYARATHLVRVVDAAR
jgi:PIN domain nuclease of toxin-antitoxin system